MEVPPKRGRGRPRKVPVTYPSKKLEFEDNGAAEVNSNEVIEHICSICDKSFKNSTALTRHISVCNENNSETSFSIDDSKDVSDKVEKTKLHCEKCSKVFIFRKSFSKHMRNEHSETPNSVSCDICDVTCPNKEILKKHIERKHDTSLYACEYCGKKFVRKAHVTRHLSQKGCDGRDLSTFPCGICNAQFTRKDNLMVHLRQQHISNRTFLCKQCDYFTTNFSKLIVHTRNKHDPKPLKFECEHCGKITKCRASITKHLEIHGEKKFICGVCNYKTFTIEVMRRHTLTHVRNKPYKCHLCSNSYIQRSQLRRHLEKHDGFTCKTCNVQFESKTELAAHEKEHGPTEGSEVYKCEICGKEFKNELTMRRHISRHTLDKPRRCMYCVRARAYLRGEQLLHHVRKHHPDVFRQRLMHVRKVLGSNVISDRVSKSELESILDVLDAESDRILEDFGTGVLYGGLQEVNESETVLEIPVKFEPLLSENELAENLKEMLSKLIDKELLEAFGWPNDTVDEILERVIENCGAHVADREKWTRVQRLRENAKYLFLYVIEDKNIARMLDTHTIDQVITHILEHVSDDS